jgi:rhodanese-related sulfurtransferase
MNNRAIIIGLAILIGLITGVWWLRSRLQADQSVQLSRNTNSSDVDQSDNRVQLISPERFDQLAQNPETFILDVHTPKQTHIPGTDAFIDYTQIKDSQPQLPIDESTPIVVYCRSGGMSAQASQDLLAMGYTRVYDLGGGTNAYKRDGTKTVTLEPDTQGLGTVIYGDVPTTEFTLTNYTDQSINVTRVSTSCGCTSAQVAKDTLSAFESTVVQVSFDPAVHKDDTDLGELTRTIYIETDHPEFKKLQANISANVVKE